MRVLAEIRIMEVMLACTVTVLRKLAVSIGESLRRHPKSGDVQLTGEPFEKNNLLGLCVAHRWSGKAFLPPPP